MGSDCLMKGAVSFWSDDVPELDTGDGCRILRNADWPPPNCTMSNG